MTGAIDQSLLGADLTGDEPAGDEPAGDEPAGDEPAGDKPAGDKPAGDKPAGDKIEITYDIKEPDGFVMAAEVKSEFLTAVKELGLTNEGAQSLVDKLLPKIAAQQESAQREAFEKYNSDLVATVKADKEIGGDKMQERLGVASRALDRFGTPELKELLNSSGLGNHPEVIRFFYRAGSKITEDKVIPSGGRAGAPSLEDRLSKMYND
jgi:hypothetical protein